MHVSSLPKIYDVIYNFYSWFSSNVNDRYHNIIFAVFWYYSGTLLLFWTVTKRNVWILQKNIVRSSVPTFLKTKEISSENNICYWWECGSGRLDHWWQLSCWSTPKHQPKHKLEKWLIISGDGIRPYLHTYVRTKQDKPIKELNHFLSWCFGGCLGVDHCTTQVLKLPLLKFLVG